MGRDRSRVLVALVGYLVLVIASTIVMDWFDMNLGFAKVGVGLRSVTMCQTPDVCVSVSFGAMKVRGMYPLMAMVTFWGSMLLALFVTYQAGTRIISGISNEPLSRLGYMGSLGIFIAAGAAGYMFGPEAGGFDQAEVLGIHIEVTRTWAPALLLLGHILGIVTLRLAVAEDSIDDAAYTPVKPELPVARVVTPIEAVPQLAPERPSTGPIPTMPEHLRKKLAYMAVTAEVTRAGIDARREDGESLLVLWRDVVGVVARRLPPEHEGATFVDIVSAPGSTVRVMPWTRLGGEALPGTGDARARALVSFAASMSPTIQIDPKTQKFADGAEAAQLPDVATLGAHDAKLA